MIHPTVKIIAISTGIVGVATGGGISIYKIINSPKEQEKPVQKEITPETITPKSITSLLDKEGKRLLTKEKDDKTKWKPSWEEFKKAYNETIPAEPWAFQNWEQDKKEVEAPDKFKELCKSNGAKNVNNEENSLYTAIKNYCSIAKEG